MLNAIHLYLLDSLCINNSAPPQRGKENIRILRLFFHLRGVCWQVIIEFATSVSRDIQNVIKLVTIVSLTLHSMDSSRYFPCFHFFLLSERVSLASDSARTPLKDARIFLVPRGRGGL